MAHLQIKNLRLRTHIGYNDHEVNKLQDVIISYQIDYDALQAQLTDDPGLSLDYKAINKNIIALVEESRFNLIEALAHQILNVIMTYSPVETATVEVVKPNALRFADSVSVTLMARRHD